MRGRKVNLNIGLGIGVGGTNTDAPLSISKKVLSVAKALTPKEYLATGISDFLNRLDRHCTTLRVRLVEP